MCITYLLRDSCLNLICKNLEQVVVCDALGLLTGGGLWRPGSVDRWRSVTPWVCCQVVVCDALGLLTGVGLWRPGSVDRWWSVAPWVCCQVVVCDALGLLTGGGLWRPGSAVPGWVSGRRRLGGRHPPSGHHGAAGTRPPRAGARAPDRRPPHRHRLGHGAARQEGRTNCQLQKKTQNLETTLIFSYGYIHVLDFFVFLSFKK